MKPVNIFICEARTNGKISVERKFGRWRRCETRTLQGNQSDRSEKSQKLDSDLDDDDLELMRVSVYLFIFNI